MTSVLIIQTAEHGDVLLTTPLIKALKQSLNDAEIDVLLYAETAPVLANNPDVRHILTVDRSLKKQGLRRQIAGELALLRNIRAARYDIILNLVDRWRTAFLSRFSGAPKTVAFSGGKRDRFLWHISFTDFVPEPPKDLHIIRRHLSILAALGIAAPSESRARLRYSDEDLSGLRKLIEPLQNQAYIVIHPAARYVYKCWDDDKNAALIARLLGRGHNIVVTGTSDAHETEMIDHILSLLPSREGGGKLLNLAGKTNVAQLAALIENAAFLIGVDSLPVHIAAGARTPSVVLFGPTSPARWAPASELTRVIRSPAYAGNIHPDIDIRDPSRRYLSDIAPETVIAAVEEMLARSKPASAAS